MGPKGLTRLLPLLLLWTLGTPSCAVDGGGVVDAPPYVSPASMPAAKLGLPAPLRPFHDELLEYGDWVLIEPVGWVFRPRVNTVAWRPYEYGHWEASWSYGWVWVSDEPFGWITDHYGFWFHDEFQGWVWQPYGAWAPSWVAWVQVGDFVGWAPLPPADRPDFDRVPGGAFTYMPVSTLASGGNASRASFVNALPVDDADLRPIDRVVSRRGVYWNAGPDPAKVFGPADADRLRLDERDGRLALPEPGPSLMREPPDLRLNVLEERTTNAWRVARREWQAVRTARAGSGVPRTGPPGSPPPPSASPSDPAPREPLPPPRIKPTPGAEDSLRDGSLADSLRRFLDKKRPIPPRGERPGAPGRR